VTQVTQGGVILLTHPVLANFPLDTDDTDDTGVARKKPRTDRSRGWFGTLNNPTDHGVQDEKDMHSLLRTTDPLSYVFQQERGENGTPHYQFIVVWKNAVVAPLTLCKQIHWEHARDINKSIKYCTKKDTRIAGPWSYNYILPKEIKTILKENMYPWQLDVLRIIDEPINDRLVYWMYEEKGNLGKTSMAKYICANYKALYLSGKATDVKYAVSEYLKKNDELHVVIFDFVRSVEDFISYDAIESIKNGIFFSGKYEGGMVSYNAPHVFCFANFEPDMSKLSADRWFIRNICLWEEKKRLLLL